MRTLVFVAALAASGALAGTASAGYLPNGGVTAQEVATVLQAKGYKAEIGKDSQGDPMISSAAEGSNFRVLFYSCTAGRCKSIQFTYAVDLPNGISLSKLNMWNREKRYGRAFVDDEQDPFVQMDLDLERGGTTEGVANNIDTWVAVLAAFKKYVGA